MKKFRLLITLLAFSLLFLISCSNKQVYRRTRFYMGTTVEFDVPIGKRSARDVKKICDIAESEISRLNEMLSIFDKSSIVSKINNDEEKRSVKVSPELFQLIKRAKEYFVLTQGAFDITVEPLVELWGFGPGKKMPPDIQKIKDVLQYVGLDKIGLDEKGETLTFGDPRMRIDFGGIAEGYAVDEVVKIFKRHNITKALINIGGDLYCIGTRADNRDWSVGIKDPENKDEILVRLKIRDKAIATSGNYENFYIYNNRRYTHIIDPRIGYTVSNNLASVTIIADDCTTADALATAVFVLGESKGLKLIDKLSGIECLLVVKRKGKQELLMSRGMGRYIEK